MFCLHCLCYTVNDILSFTKEFQNLFEMILPKRKEVEICSYQHAWSLVYSCVSIPMSWIYSNKCIIITFFIIYKLNYSCKYWRHSNRVWLLGHSKLINNVDKMNFKTALVSWELLLKLSQSWHTTVSWPCSPRGECQLHYLTLSLP